MDKAAELRHSGRVAGLKLELCLWFGALLILLGSFVYQPGSMPVLSVCPFRLLTSHECPFCGLTRGFCALSQGQVKAALELSPFGPLLYLANLLVLGLASVDLAARSSFLRRLGRRLHLDQPWTYVGITLTMWVVNLLL